MKKTDTFEFEAEQILNAPVKHRANKLGGYGERGEVIYERHPSGCPSVLADERGPATAMFMSNGSTAFKVRTVEGLEVDVLKGHFDAVEKREIGVPSANVWMNVSTARETKVVSLINPGHSSGMAVKRTRVVKMGDPDRAMWYCVASQAASGALLETAVRHRLVSVKGGVALDREIYIVNRSEAKSAEASIWTCLDLHGTQRFVYNKSLWYDMGMPLSKTETVVRCVVPYTEIQQIKRVASKVRNARAVAATCDYGAFVGDTAAVATLPVAVKEDQLLKGGIGMQLNRFATAMLAANQFKVNLRPGASASIQQRLLYVTDAGLLRDAARAARAAEPSYEATVKSFKAMAALVVKRTAGAGVEGVKGEEVKEAAFQIQFPELPVMSAYANSLWMGVTELYDKCRAHGSNLADGIELGTRDRAQDMWPKMKDDPGRVRADLVHAMSFMYVTCNKPPRVGKRPLSIREKLHGMFPRQYPSRWLDRQQKVMNDNRPYADSPVWLIDALNMYVRETGDLSILAERVATIRLTDPERPEMSGIIGNDLTLTIAEVISEVLACFERHVDDSPYGIVQAMYGDWCDPLDMFGTSVVGDAKTRGRGRGSIVRLSVHVFDCLVHTIDTFTASGVKEALKTVEVTVSVSRLKRFADRLRMNIVRVAWEEGQGRYPAGFIGAIHELRLDGSRPAYKRGEIGYTLGSVRGLDFDGRKRRELTVQAFGLNMLLTQRDYLTPVQSRDQKVVAILQAMDELFFRNKLGLMLFTVPIPNTKSAVELVGRMGVVPPGCAENGEYHHGQMMMHRFRQRIRGQSSAALRQFLPIVSAMRDESLSGPFESSSTSYVSDASDPHFGKGMYFGLSGSTDWIVEYFQEMVGLKFALHDKGQSDLVVTPRLPAALKGTAMMRRIIHVAQPNGGYKKVPVEISIRRAESEEGKGIRINGKVVRAAEVKDVAQYSRIKIEIVG